jgi:hypothetical protein
MNTRTGFFAKIRSRLFGELDPIESQLKEISRQGAGMARVAHLCAIVMIFLFSLGSLVALGGDALNSIIAEWNRGQVDVPSSISVAVSTLFVACMDVGMVYAASVLRRLAARRADPAEKRLYTAVIAGVTVLEASTYAYMSVRYEHPANLAVLALILARAATAPLLSVFLAMARPIPVSSRDILYQAELITGTGVLRHVTVLANNPEAKLADLLLMYQAAGYSSESDRKRLSDLIQVAQSGSSESSASVTVFETDQGPTFPTGGGTPVQISEALDSAEDLGNVVALERNLERSVAVPLQPAAEAVAPSKKRPYRSFPTPAAEEAAGFAVLDEAGWTDEGKPAMSKAAFRRVMNINNDDARALYSRWYYSRKPHQNVTPGVEQDVAQ